MSLFGFLTRRSTAPVARERLQILLAHERASAGPNSELVAVLKEEILSVLKKHMPIERDKVMVKLDRGASVSTLEIDIEMPAFLPPKAPPAGATAAARA